MKGFKQFLLRGNVVDMAVGIVIGAAFGTVVTGFVKDLLTPFIAALVKQARFFRVDVYDQRQQVSLRRFYQCFGFVCHHRWRGLLLCRAANEHFDREVTERTTSRSHNAQMCRMLERKPDRCTTVCILRTTKFSPVD